MLDIKYIIANIDDVKKKTAARKADFDFDMLISLDEKRKNLQAEADVLKAERNSVSKEVGAIKKAGGDISEIQAKMRAAGDRIAAIDAELADAQTQMNDMLLTLPNVVKDEVPSVQTRTIINFSDHGESPQSFPLNLKHTGIWRKTLA